MSSEIALVAVLVVAFGAAVFLAAAETSLLRITPVRATTLAAEHGRSGEQLTRLIDRLPRVLNTILLLALLAQVGAATVVGILASGWFGSLGVTLASVVLTVVMFIYAEAIPKTFAVRHTDRVALIVARPVAFLEWVLRPIVWVLVSIADLQAPGKGIETSPTVTEDELRLLARHAAVEGEIDVTDMELIERAFRFGDRRTDDIMVPRTDIVAVQSDVSVRDAVQVALGAGHRRLVVFGTDLDDVTGIVRIRDLVALPSDRAGIPVGQLTREPLVVPESKRIVSLLREMQAASNHIAVVVDEYGGTAGIVTVEDVAEQLLGSIWAHSVDGDIVHTDDGGWSVDGLVPIEDLEATLDVDFGEGPWNTVGGLVVSHLGHLPSVGDEVRVAGYVMLVTATRGHRARRIKVTPH